MNIPVSVVVPCYNEANRLAPDKFIEFMTFRKGVRYVFVDDGSKDNTLEILDQIRSKAPDRVEVLRMEQNLGKAEAVRTGMLHSFENHSTDYIAFIDADLAIPIDQIDALVTDLRIKKKSIALSSRRLKPVPGDYGLRSVFSAWLSKLIKAQFFPRERISDTQCGCKAFSREIVPGLFGEPFISKWLFDVEVILRAKDLGELWKMVVEVPLPRLNDNSGSKVAPLYAIWLLGDMIKIERKY
jgi:glycosyltransferase involved in cell wall biosynthesis